MEGNPHDFKVNIDPLPYHSLNAESTGAELAHAYNHEGVTDANLGRLDCDLAGSGKTVYCERMPVFAVQAYPYCLGKIFCPSKARTWLGGHRVFADPRLHPDTIEYLVQKVAFQSSVDGLEATLLRRKDKFFKDQKKRAKRASAQNQRQRPGLRNEVR